VTVADAAMVAVLAVLIDTTRYCVFDVTLSDLRLAMQSGLSGFAPPRLIHPRPTMTWKSTERVAHTLLGETVAVSLVRLP